MDEITHKKIKVLWFSNVEYSENKPTSTGTWLHAMFIQLKLVPELVDICCCITFGNVTTTERKDYIDTHQYIIPKKYCKKNGLPTNNCVTEIVNIIKSENPDVIHVWGVEYYWGLICNIPDIISKYKVLLEIQGIKGVCANKKYYYGGLNTIPLLKMFGLRELLCPTRFVLFSRLLFKKWGHYEELIIKGINNINTQSQWVRDIISKINHNANVYKTGIILRDEFYTPNKWHSVHKFSDHKIIFTTTSALQYKGAHITIRAFRQIKDIYPDSKLRIAGISIKEGSSINKKNKYLNTGYTKYLLSLLKKLNLTGSVEFLGDLNSEQLVEEMYKADVFVMSSYVETYCLALAEAILVGLPCVSAYTTALSELINDNETGLYYPQGDCDICADKINRLLSDIDFSKYISKNASDFMTNKSNISSIRDQQINIYRQIIGNN